MKSNGTKEVLCAPETERMREREKRREREKEGLPESVLIGNYARASDSRN